MTSREKSEDWGTALPILQSDLKLQAIQFHLNINFILIIGNPFLY